MGLIRVSDEAEGRIKELSNQWEMSITKTVDRILVAAESYSPSSSSTSDSSTSDSSTPSTPDSEYMTLISDMDLVSIVSGNIPAISIPNPLAVKFLTDPKNHDLFVDENIFTKIDENFALEDTQFVITRGCICARDHSYPTTDWQVMRVDNEMLKELKAGGIF